MSRERTRNAAFRLFNNLQSTSLYSLVDDSISLYHIGFKKMSQIKLMFYDTEYFITSNGEKLRHEK